MFLKTELDFRRPSLNGKYLIRNTFWKYPTETYRVIGSAEKAYPLLSPAAMRRIIRALLSIESEHSKSRKELEIIEIEKRRRGKL